MAILRPVSFFSVKTPEKERDSPYREFAKNIQNAYNVNTVCCVGLDGHVFIFDIGQSLARSQRMRRNAHKDRHRVPKERAFNEEGRKTKIGHESIVTK